MMKFKRFLAIVMIAILVFSMTACGNKDKDDDDNDKGKTEQTNSKADTVDASELFKAIEKGLGYNKGTYELKFDVSEDTDDEDAAMTGSLKGTRDGENNVSSINLDVSYEGEELSLSANDLFVVADGMAYINFDSFLDAFLDVDAELGSFGIPTPDFKSVDSDVLKGHLIGMLKALLVSDVKQSGDTYTISLETAEEYYNGIKGLVSYLDENSDDINSAFTSSSDINAVKDYLKDVVDYLGEDLAAVFVLLENPVDSDELTATLKEAIDEFELEETEVDLFKNFETVVESANALTIEDYEEMLAGSDVITELEVTLTDTDFSCKFTFKMEVGDESVSIGINYSFKGDDSVSVTVPENAATLTEMLQYLIDNPEILEEITGDVGGLPVDIPNGDTPSGDEGGSGTASGEIGTSSGSIPTGGNSNAVNTDFVTFKLYDGKVVTVTYDKDVYEVSKYEEDYLDVYLLALDGSESEVDVCIWDEMDAEYAYSSMLGYYEELEENILAKGTATINGLSGYGFQVSTGYDGFLECHYFVDLAGTDSCIEYDLWYFDDSIYTENELLAAVVSVTAK